MAGAKESLPGAKESPGADNEAEAPKRPVELVEDGGKGLKEVTPVPRGISTD